MIEQNNSEQFNTTLEKLSKLEDDKRSKINL